MNSLFKKSLWFIFEKTSDAIKGLMILALSAFLDYKNLCSFYFLIRHPGNPDMRSPVRDLNFVQYLLLDVMATLLIAIGIVHGTKNFNNVFITLYVRTSFYPSYVFSYHFNIDLSKKIIPFFIQYRNCVLCTEAGCRTGYYQD